MFNCISMGPCQEKTLQCDTGFIITILEVNVNISETAQTEFVNFNA